MASLSDVQHFLSRYADYQRCTAVANRDTGGNFNIFQILGVHRKEACHSALLAALLDPAGPHGQGAVFLEEFFAMCCRRFPGCFETFPPGITDGRWTVMAELSTDSGRPDLVLRSHDRDVLVLIENKVDAGEQETQIGRYRRWLDSDPRRASHRALIYLTPTGMAPTSGTADAHLSYKDHIAEWLRCAIARTAAASVAQPLTQYLQLVENIDRVAGDAFMHQIDDEVAFLARPENVQCALKIGGLRDRLQHELCQRFCERVRQGVIARLDSRVSAWTIEVRENNLYIHPRSSESAVVRDPGARICAQVDPGQDLVVGVCWNRRIALAERQSMMSFIEPIVSKSSGFEQRSTEWWILYKSLEAKVGYLSVMEKVADGPLSNQVIDELVALCDSIDLELAALNARP
jgi:hypothetical protein